MTLVLAVDIGGSFVKSAVTRPDGQLYDFQKVATPTSLDAFMLVMDQLVDANDIQGIAISSPGSIESSGLNVGYSAVPYLYHENLKVLCEGRYGVPVSIENDGNCAALAEYECGAAEGIASFVCIVIGTGIGGGIVHHGELLRGAHLHAGEFGYLMLDMANGNTWSETGSSSALTKRAGFLNGEEVFKRAGHSPEAASALEHFFHTLAAGIFSIQYILDPQRVLLGGGITQQSAFLKGINEAIEALYRQKSYAAVKPEIRLCQAGSHAQLTGAVHLWKKQWKDEAGCLQE
ncbi:ROK family protein [Jeotgalibacillus haloalkalitolerans]|uniref:ROK family protein n=1 Tax=Jeotgalibacillus haloalkalitolerans TaxID=3104292 RepID=A0ABU5KJH6_9BACL|nr:ROK family protein [Jeotgalibacillus sp. HH7-29]MDZ5711417.1 ROK family protein [Jeotgalibacillus sp. HH7-29]